MSDQTVKCPGCGKTVSPKTVTSTATPTAPADATPSGERWSFAWRPPSGSVCPECFFPLDRYQRRRPWILTFRVGVVFATVAILLQLGIRFASLPPAVVPFVRVAGVIGAAAIVVGLIGMLVGGRHSIEGQA